MTDWLNQLKTDLKIITLPLARQYWTGLSAVDEPYYNYRFQHVEQVERDARRLMVTYGGDEEIVLASVWIHDRCQPQFEGEKHGEKAAEWADENLVNMGFPTKKVEAVVYAVRNHSNSPKTIPKKAKEAQILWDADKLNKIGAISVVYTLCSCAAFPQTKVTYKWIQTALRSGLEKLQWLPSSYYFPLSREIGRKRYNTLKLFCDALDEEVGI